MDKDDIVKILVQLLKIICILIVKYASTSEKFMKNKMKSTYKAVF